MVNTHMRVGGQDGVRQRDPPQRSTSPPGPPVVISRRRIEYHGVGTGRNCARHRSQQGWGEAAGTQAPPDHRSVLV